MKHTCWKEGKVDNGPCLVLRHGRDVLPTRDKSTTGNVALRFWVLVLGRSCDERLSEFLMMSNLSWDTGVL